MPSNAVSTSVTEMTSLYLLALRMRRLHAPAAVVMLDLVFGRVILELRGA